jgi:hypothetical protein
MSFPYLLAQLGPLRIEHLQLDEDTTDMFRRRGVSSIADLVIEVGQEPYPSKEGIDAVAALDRLAAVSRPRDIDWLTYWRGNDYQFHHRFLTCPELEEMDSSNPVCGLGKMNFGNAGAMLSRYGISTLGDLASGLRHGLPDVPGMGAKKWAELFRTLVELVRDLRDGRISRDFLATCYPLDGGIATSDLSSSSSIHLSEGTRAMHIGVLHLGTKATTLEAQGVRTVGDAASALPSLLSISGVGRTTVTALETHLGLLAEAQSEDGNVDWERYCRSIGVPLLPLAGDPVNGAAFVGGLAGVIAEIGFTLDDYVLRLIIDRRLSRLPHQRATLEEIGSTEGVDLTRERVRQIESRFLKWMLAGLLDDNYSNLDVHFRPGFASFWRAAADRFSDSEEIGHATLIEGLGEVWKVDPVLLSQHLPFIVTIISGDVPTGKSLGDGALLAKDFLNLPLAAADLPVRRLQLGKQVYTLEAHGLDTLGKFVAAVSAGTVSRSRGRHFRSAIDHLNHLSGALDDGEGVDWDAYIARVGAGVIPDGPTLSPSELLRQLVPILTKLLEAGVPTDRSSVIFARRTSHAVETRISAETLAKELGAHGSSIKREETVLLAFLNEVLINGNLAIAGAHVRKDFLSIWKDAAECFEAENGDPARFKARFSGNWQINPTVVERAIPTFFAVLTGYPYKRLGRYTRLAAPRPKIVISLPIIGPSDQDLSSRIVLRGFRRQH